MGRVIYEVSEDGRSYRALDGTIFEAHKDPGKNPSGTHVCTALGESVLVRPTVGPSAAQRPVFIRARIADEQPAPQPSAEESSGAAPEERPEDEATQRLDRVVQRLQALLEAARRRGSEVPTISSLISTGLSYELNEAADEVYHLVDLLGKDRLQGLREVPEGCDDGEDGSEDIPF